VITGGSSGIGRATVLALAAEAAVAIGGRKASARGREQISAVGGASGEASDAQGTHTST
jgi:NAD(P)-dependent dehydrogenase (short-subunit alcohol dehydrogenase family)